MAHDIQFDKLDFEGFRRLATMDGLSHHERVGFPDSYREGKETAIFRDVCQKVGALAGQGKIVLEVGPGCSQLPLMLAALCGERGHRLHLVDSPEMLALLPNAPSIEKHSGMYPQMPALLSSLAGTVDVIIVYSVVQYIFAEGNIWDFLDKSLALLAPGGEMLVGDLPNISMRKRFFASDAGYASHRAYTGRDEKPEVRFQAIESGQMDDAVILGLLARARAAGFHAWILPQAADVPMANRREDLLIRRP